MEMARETKLPYDFVTGEPINIEKLEAFAALVRADERDACAKVCEEIHNKQGAYEIGQAFECAEAIRGQA
jgi:hypothetical protein